MKKRPVLTIANQNKRLNWALEKISFSDKWKNVIFSDEKKVNSDEPNGIASYTLTTCLRKHYIFQNGSKEEDVS